MYQPLLAGQQDVHLDERDLVSRMLTLGGTIARGGGGGSMGGTVPVAGSAKSKRTCSCLPAQNSQIQVRTASSGLSLWLPAAGGLAAAGGPSSVSGGKMWYTLQACPPSRHMVHLRPCLSTYPSNSADHGHAQPARALLPAWRRRAGQAPRQLQQAADGPGRARAGALDERQEVMNPWVGGSVWNDCEDTQAWLRPQVLYIVLL